MPSNDPTSESECAATAVGVAAERPSPPAFREALRFWQRLGWISFGGPAGQIAIMHREVVERRRWMSEEHFLHALNFCMLLPGPEAQQLATYLGWRLHGARGGVAAGALFVLPSVLILWALSWLYIAGGELRWVQGVFYGLTPAVIAIVLAAVKRIGGKALKTPALWGVAALSFAAIFFLHAPFVAIVLTAGLVGLAGGRWLPGHFPTPPRAVAGLEEGSADAVAVLPPAPTAGLRRSLTVLALGLGLWWTPVLACGGLLGWQSVPFQAGLFFSKAALVTIGGAYAVLPYVSQMAVERFGWLAQRQMMAGLGLAETTPGPLIMVLQFVGFVAAWQHPGNLPPLAAATLAAGLTTWVTFLPSFLFIFLGGPHVERLRERTALAPALTAITAAVVGVILNLAIWFAWHALFPAAGQGPDLFVAGMSVAALVAMERLKAPAIPTLAVCALAGVLWTTVPP